MDEGEGGRRIVEELERCRTVSEVGRSLRAFAAHHGYPYFLFGLMIPTSPIKPTHFVITGWPAAWKKIYEERDLVRVDPMLQHAFHSLNVRHWGSGQPMGAGEKDFFKLAAPYGLVEGVTCPVAGRRGERGHLSLHGPAGSGGTKEQRVAMARTLHWVAAEMYEAVVRVAFTAPKRTATSGRQRTRTPATLPRPTLTRREQEILLLFLDGQTAADVAKKLSISERTVWWHFNEAGDKLGEAGRERIMAAATSSGAIDVQEVGLRTGLARPEGRVYDA